MQAQLTLDGQLDPPRVGEWLRCRESRGEDVAKYLADLVICAARFADGIVDLDHACRARLEEKFSVKPDPDPSVG